MIVIRDPVGNEAPLKAKQVGVTDNIGEINQISFIVNADDLSSAGGKMIGARSIVTIPETGQMYRLTNAAWVGIGNYQQFTVTGTHVGYDLHDRWCFETVKGSKSLDDCMKMITKDTPFKYKIDGKFDNYNFTDDFGNGYCDDLLINTLADNFGFEFEFDNYNIHIAKEIGKHDAFLFVDNVNASKITVTEDYSTLTTRIQGTGKDPNEDKDTDDPDDSGNDSIGDSSSGGWISPVGGKGRFVSGQLFGGTSGRSNVHDGLDFGSLMGWSHTIVSPHDSEIVYVGYDAPWAHGAIVGKAGGLYWICQEYSNSWSRDTFVHVGQKVKKGDHIANMTNDHLHFGMTKISAQVAINGSNTTAGFIDPRPYIGV